MKKYLIFIFSIFIVTLTAFSAERSAKIFTVNLFEEKVDIKVGDAKNFVFLVNGLDSYTSSSMLKTTTFSKQTLYYKRTTDTKWEYLAEKIDIKPSKCYSIVIDEEGTIKWFICEDSFGKGAKIAFLNGSFDEVNRMEIGDGWNEKTAAFAEKLAPYTITNFVDIKEGNYSAFWQFPHQIESNQYYFYPTDNNTNKMIFSFTDKSYFLFLVYTINNEDYVQLFDITPQ